MTGVMRALRPNGAVYSAMTNTYKRPILMLLTSHWLCFLGAAMATTAGFSWLFALPIQLRGRASNPYIGILAFIAIPSALIAGLILIAIGVYLGRKRLEWMQRELMALPDRQTYIRQIAIFFALTTAANIVIGTQGTYRAVEHMESPQFCGQTCHVMKPEFIARQSSPHAQVACVDCHVAPGAEGWVKSKAAGTRQLIDVLLNDVPKPIESAIQSARLVPSRLTCERCHWPQMFDAVKLRVIEHFQDDAANTQTQTVLMMMTGGGELGGIHGKHMGPGVEIHYAASDPARQTIPWVEYRNRNTGLSKTFAADGSNPASVANLPRFEMQCVDCHNRPTHTFDLPERAVDQALARGEISSTLPFIKKEAVLLLKAKYASDAEASYAIPSALTRYYQESDPTVSARRSQDIAAAGAAIAAIYNRNVVPDLKVTWGTYPNNLGHTDFPGCFRCHDGSHNTADQKTTITQDCNACHQPLGMDENPPGILKTLQLTDYVASLQKK